MMKRRRSNQHSRRCPVFHIAPLPCKQLKQAKPCLPTIACIKSEHQQTASQDLPSTQAALVRRRWQISPL
jgi:hypothetical protein